MTKIKARPATERTPEQESAGSVLELPVVNKRSNEKNQDVLREARMAYLAGTHRDIAVTRQPTEKGELVTIAKTAPGVSGEPKPSEGLPEDPFGTLERYGKVITPPFDLLALAMLPEYNSELRPCVEAMEVNIDGYGHRLVSRLKAEPSVTDQDMRSKRTRSKAKKGEKEKAPPKKDPELEALETEAKTELARVTNFFQYCTEESFPEFRRKLRGDLELTGNAYFEVLRTTTDEIAGFAHVPSYQIRLGRADEDALLVDTKVCEIDAEGAVAIKTIKQWKRFRRFVQSRAIHTRGMALIGADKVRWYKSFGDPRPVHKETGDYESEGQPIPENKRASELVHFRLFSARSPYGLPRFIGNLLAIYGDRASEEINFITFRNNNIPSMAVLVSNGQLTQGTIERLTSFIESQIQGSDNYSKFVIVEAENAAEEGEDGGQVKVDIKPLVADQHKDALFQNYSKNNQDRVRRSFRLPKIFVANSDGYNRATAEADRRLADEQVFAPERNVFDDWVNRRLFPLLNVVFHKFRSNTPNTTDNQQLVKILATSEKTGGMTPRIARAVLEEILGKELDPFPDDFDPDVPFSLTMAEAVKNEADPAEPGQQVTALKALKALGIWDGEELKMDFDEDTVGEIVQKLSALQAASEAVQLSKSD
jgi:PBSX family phage portal protein